MITYTRYIRHLTKKQRVTLVPQASSRSLDAMATLAEQLLSQGCDESGRHSCGVSASEPFMGMWMYVVLIYLYIIHIHTYIYIYA